MRKLVLRFVIVSCLFCGVFLPEALALKLNNGNVFALYFSEAKTDKEAKEVFEEWNEKACYFRYLQIISMKAGKKKGNYPYIDFVCYEPSSYMNVEFTITKSVSIQKLWEEPAVKVGDAIAIKGRIFSASKKSNSLVVYPVLVKHRDRLDVKMGKELLSEIDKTATTYQYTAGDKPVDITREDMDLLQYKNKIISSKGKQGWSEFLLTELAKRKKARNTKKIKDIKAKLNALVEDPAEEPKKKTGK